MSGKKPPAEKQQQKVSFCAHEELTKNLSKR